MMYSRYTPNGNGGYDRRMLRVSRPAPQPQPQPEPAPPPAPPPVREPPPPPPERRPGGLLPGLGRLLPARLDKGDLLMLAILYLIFSEDEEDPLLPLLAIGLYLFLK